MPLGRFPVLYPTVLARFAILVISIMEQIQQPFGVWLFEPGYKIAPILTGYLDMIDLLIQNLADLNTWTHIDFLVLRAETERGRDFALKPARGGLQPFLRFDGFAWDRRDYRNNVNYKFLEWTEG